MSLLVSVMYVSDSYLRVLPWGAGRGVYRYLP